MRHAHRSRGIALLLVLGTIVVTTVMGLAFISAQSTNLGIAQNVNRHAMARAIAEAGMELALTEVKTNANWRTDFSHGVWVTDEALNGGTFTITGEDGEDTNGSGTITQPTESDGDLADDNADTLTLTVVGKYEGVTHTVINVVTATETITMDVLLVVSDDTSLHAQDQAKKTLFESWGYTVNVIDDGAAQSAYDTAIGENDVVYVSETVNSGSIGTKLNNAPIGVVCDEDALADDLLMSSSGGTTTTTTAIDIVDNTHYITSVFFTGSLTIYSSSTYVKYNPGTLASGSTTLADQSGGGTSAVLWVADAGDVLTDGTLAAGRRAIMPWGGTGVDINLLNSDGETLLKRALEWAGESITPQNPVARWQLNETSGTTAVDDVASNNGTYINAPTLGELGPSGGAVQFNGSNQRVDVPHTSAYLLNDGTISMWIKPDTVSGYQDFFWKDDGGYGTGGNFEVYLLNNRIVAVLRSTSQSYTIQSGNVLQSGEWYHVAVRFGAGGYVLYLNGDPVATNSYAGGWGTNSGGAGNSNSIEIGSSTHWGDYFDGTIDDTRIYNYGLSGAEIKTIYDAGVAALGGGGSEPTLVALYEFDEAFATPNLIAHWQLNDTGSSSVNNVLFVVGNAGSPGSSDQAAKTLMESWGYTVNLIDDSDSQANFNTAFGNNDVVYISEMVTDSTVDTKAKDAPIGVVTEENGIHSRMEMSSSNGSHAEETIRFDITDNSHYITSGFSLGSLTILTGSDDEGIVYNSGTLPAGVTALGDRNGSSTTPVLLIAEAGGTLDDGNPAPARRVMLPWGGEDYSFNYVNTNGRTILQRSLEWAGGGSTAIDQVGSYDGTLQSGATFVNDATRGQVLELDGSDDHVDVGTGLGNLTGGFTITAWIKRDNQTGTQRIISANSTVAGYGFGFVGTTIRFTTFNVQNYDVALAGGTINTGQWHHVAVVFDNDYDATFFVDGVNVGSVAGSSPPNASAADKFFLGRSWYSNEHFDGRLSQVRIYNRALDSGQIANVMADSDPGLPSEGDRVEDTSGYGSAFNLTIPDTADTDWIGGGGLDITSATTIQANSVASQLRTALVATNEMTLEVKFTPANLTQNDCARIVSFSNSIGNRNFTLGQDGQKYEFRLRTSVTGTNGTPDIESGDVLDTSTVHHVIVTFDGTDVKMYRNGSQEVSTARGGDFSNWGTTYDLLMANEESDDRAWLGKIYRIAVYDAALNNSQVTNVFNGNPPGDGTTANATFSARWVEDP